MKKNISICLIMLALVLVVNFSASAATYVYTLDIEITNPALFPDVEDQIGGVEFDAYGGVLYQDYTLAFGDAIPSGQGNWIELNGGTYIAVFDDYDWETPQYAPMGSGNVLTITSDVELTFANLEFFSFLGDYYAPGYLTTRGFVELPGAVPVPSGFLLLGAGLIGLLGFARKK